MAKMTAIPTTYAGVEFRSRLEAKWACFFDLVGWKWTYEPFDLAGWIPDFMLAGVPRGVLVEVKPEHEWDATETELGAIKTPHEILIVGEAPFLHETECEWCSQLGRILEHDFQPDPPVWQRAAFGRRSDRGFGFCAEQGHWGDRISGIYHGNCTLTAEPDRAIELWRNAGNAVQWKAPGGGWGRQQRGYGR